MNYRVMNALRKIAADENSRVAGSTMIKGTNIPSDYLDDRAAAWVDAPGASPSPRILRMEHNLKTIEDLRRLQSRRIPQDVFKLTPGSPEYTEMRRYLYRRGPVNYYNWRYPEDPMTHPEVPRIKDRTGKIIDPKQIEAWGNTIAGRRGGYGGPQYS